MPCFSSFWSEGVQREVVDSAISGNIGDEMKFLLRRPEPPRGERLCVAALWCYYGYACELRFMMLLWE